MSHGGGVAAIYGCTLSITAKPHTVHNSFENLIFSLSHQSGKTILIAIVYRAPGPYSNFLSEFPEFLASLVLKTDKVIIVGDFNIHVDVVNDSCSTAFMSTMESIGFSQWVHEPTHSLNHTLDLVLTYGVQIEHLVVSSYNPILSDHLLITFDFMLFGHTNKGKSIYSRRLTDEIITGFKEAAPLALSSVPTLHLSGDSCFNPSPSYIDHLTDSVTGSLHNTLNSIAPITLKTISRRKTAPWYSPETRKLKQLSRKLERRWRSTRNADLFLIWKESLKTYRQAIYRSRASYYLSLIEVNKDNPRFLFSTVARLTQGQNSIEQSIPQHLSGSDFLDFFNNKIITIREAIVNPHTPHPLICHLMLWSRGGSVNLTHP